ncbi:hypothetical protein BY996DRAFT_8490750 [Phakopsora pachyrhizi]|nr:hypothetical protein BY996DRAFT_8490750 [Phakopsora pachyrhizi]
MLLYYKKLRFKDYLEAIEVVIQNYLDQKLLKATKLCLTLLVQVNLGTFTILLDSLLEQTYKIRDEIEYWSELKSDWLKAACYLLQTFHERIFYSIRNDFPSLNSLSSLPVQGSGVLTTGDKGILNSSPKRSQTSHHILKPFLDSFLAAFQLPCDSSWQESRLRRKFLEESYGELVENIGVLLSTLNELKSEIKNSGGLTERPKAEFSGLINCMSLATKIVASPVRVFTAAKVAFSYWQSAIDFMSDFRATINRFFKGWVIRPIEDIIKTLRAGKSSSLAIMSKDSVVEDLV